MEDLKVLVLPGWASGPGFFAELFEGTPCTVNHASWKGAKSADDLPRIAKEAADSLPAGKFVLFGWSLGAMVAIETAPELAGRLEALWLAAPCLRFTDGWSARVLARMKKRLSTDPKGLLSDFAAGIPALPETAVHPASALPMEWDTPAESLAAGLDYLAVRDLSEFAKPLGIPVAIFHGDADTVVPLSLSYPVAAAYGTPRSILFGAGHAPMYTRARETAGILIPGERHAPG